MSGFDCQFTEEPPKAFQCYCPICLLILREPYQVTCCGKSFCRACVQQIEAKGKPCPTCKEEDFDSFPNKGLQQPLYGFRVFCSNKEGGCGWQGELGQLDQHLNMNPDRDNQLVGCAYTKVKCIFCDEYCRRSDIEDHQTSKCLKRPFTCTVCDEYKSTYADVTTNHAPECKCRPVECPNSCGASNLQHQHLEEHVSSQCPLTCVECEFSDAGCDAKVYRRDLPSHLSANMVTHMSLLARENRKLKEEARIMKQQLLAPAVQPLFHIPPLRLKWHHDIEESFYSHAGGYKLKLQATLTQLSKLRSRYGMLNATPPQLSIKYTLMESEFVVKLPRTLIITTKIIDQEEDRDHIVMKYELVSNKPAEHLLIYCMHKHHNDYNFIFHVTDVTVV